MNEPTAADTHAHMVAEAMRKQSFFRDAQLRLVPFYTRERVPPDARNRLEEILNEHAVSLKVFADEMKNGPEDARDSMATWLKGLVQPALDPQQTDALLAYFSRIEANEMVEEVAGGCCLSATPMSTETSARLSDIIAAASPVPVGSKAPLQIDTVNWDAVRGEAAKILSADQLLALTAAIEKVQYAAAYKAVTGRRPPERIPGL